MQIQPYACDGICWRWRYAMRSPSVLAFDCVRRPLAFVAANCLYYLGRDDVNVARIRCRHNCRRRLFREYNEIQLVNCEVKCIASESYLTITTICAINEMLIFDQFTLFVTTIIFELSRKCV